MSQPLSVNLVVAPAAADADVSAPVPVARRSDEDTESLEALIAYYEDLGETPQRARQKAASDLVASRPIEGNNLPAVIDRRVAPAELGLVCAPLAILLANVALLKTGPLIFFAAVLASSAWGLARLVRDRRLSRTVVAALAAPVAATSSLTAIWALCRGLDLFGFGRHFGLEWMTVGLLAMVAGVTAIFGATSGWLARAGRGEARFLLYYQATMLVICIPFSLGSGLSWSVRLWPLLTLGVWGASLAHYLTGDAKAADRASRMMRAWLSMGLTTFILTTLMFNPASYALRNLAIVLSILLPLFIVDRSLGRSPERPEALPPAA